MIDRLDAMATFVAVIEHGSLSGAARALGRSLPAVSRQIAALEAHLSARLLTRTTRALAATDEGRLYYERARRILGDVQETERAVNAEAAIASGRLHVSAPALLGRLRLAPLLPIFLARHPRVDIDLSLSDRPVSLIEEGIDIALVIGALPDSRLMARRLGEVRMVVCAAPSYLAEHGEPTAPDEIAQHHCLVFAAMPGRAEWAFRGPDGSRHAVRVPSPRLSANALDAAVTAAIGGAGLVRAPSWQVAEPIATGTLRAVLTGFERPAAPLHALTPPGRAQPAKTRAFLDFLVRQWAHGPEASGA